MANDTQSALREHWSAASARRKDGYRHAGVLVLITLGFVLIGKAVLWPLDAALALLPVSAPVSVDSFLVAGSAVLGVVRPTQDVPLTLVEIDEALYAEWGRPCVTPRDQLARLIGLVAAQQPTAIVVDINLDCATGADCTLGGACDLNAFFAEYRGPPLILVRGMYMETSPNSEPKVRASRTAYEDAIASNPNILWAHTMYLTDADGTVRRWRDAWEACTDAGTETVLAVPLQLAAALTGHGSLTQAPPRSGLCTFAAQTSPQHLVILGGPITGQAQLNTSGPRVLPARHLLDSDRAVERGGYFSVEGRVVIIGATHAASGDIWRTPIGLMPGMELIAHTLRFAPVQIERQLQNPDRRDYSKPITLVAFWMLALLGFVLRPSVVVILAGVLSFVAIFVATGVFGRFDVFESLALSLWIFIEFAVVLAFWELFREIGVYRKWRALRVLLAKRIRSADPETK